MTLGEWEPLPVNAVVELFDAAPFRWWISGGHALELHFGRSWRTHGDLDVGICRSDVGAIAAVLDGWDLQVASGGRLRPFDGSIPSGHGNNLWCRTSSTSGWQLDVTIGDGDDQRWIYRRDPSFTLPWTDAVLRTSAGVPYLAPDLQLLFKSKEVQAKDQLDAEQVIPALDAPRLARLAEALPGDHPWQELISRGRRA